MIHKTESWIPTNLTTSFIFSAVEICHFNAYQIPSFVIKKFLIHHVSNSHFSQFFCGMGAEFQNFIAFVIHTFCSFDSECHCCVLSTSTLSIAVRSCKYTKYKYKLNTISLACHY
jgi:hypothetical protein